MRARTLLAAAVSVTLLAIPAGKPSRAAEPAIKYPAKVSTLSGYLYRLDDLGGELERGSFVMFDGETEGRIPWRDIDTVTFVENIGHRPGAAGPTKKGTQRVEIKYVDGQTRYANIVIGRVWGFDGIAHRVVPPRDLASIDFDVVRIAPVQYKTCEHGHVWEQPDFRFCPYDGLELIATRVDGGR